ncbi:MAG: DUF58 domain-containing protein [Planctomycetales bacterium]|nr:DUF58 domain-containing protein [Planctomycetales bacterium]
MPLLRDQQNSSRLKEGLGVAASLAGALLVLLALQAAWTSTHSFFAQMLLLAAGVYLGMWGLHSSRKTRQAITGWLGWTGRRRYRTKWTMEAIVYAVILTVLFAGSMLGRQNILRLVFCLMAGPFILNGQVTFWALRRTSVRRSYPTRVMAGETFTVDLTLTNGKRWLSSWMMEAHDGVQIGRDNLRAAVLFTRVPPKSERTGHYQMRLMNRGRVEFSSVRIASRFPLGLLERAVVFDEPGELLVYPRLGQLTSQWEQKLFSAEEVVRPPVSRRGAFDDEFHRLREYRPGDSPRSIHWRTSARMNSLMVREFHQHRDRDLLIVLDLWQPSRDVLTADSDLIERAVSFVATMCVRQCRQARDSGLWLAVHGRQTVRWTGTAGLDVIDALLELLTLVESTPDQLPGELVRDWPSQAPDAMRHVLVTTRTRPDAESQLNSIGAADERTGNNEPFHVVTADAASLSELMQWN